MLVSSGRKAVSNCKKGLELGQPATDSAFLQHPKVRALGSCHLLLSSSTLLYLHVGILACKLPGRIAQCPTLQGCRAFNSFAETDPGEVPGKAGDIPRRRDHRLPVPFVEPGAGLKLVM